MKRLTRLAILAAFGAASTLAHAEGSDSGAAAGSADGGDNSMAVRQGDSWFALQGDREAVPVVDVRILARADADAPRYVDPFRDDTGA